MPWADLTRRLDTMRQQPTTQTDWNALQAEIAIETLVMIAGLRDDLSDIERALRPMLKRLAADVAQIKLNTAPD